jgi:transcriptional regulator with PAS, ATPase and Fis domain
MGAEERGKKEPQATEEAAPLTMGQNGYVVTIVTATGVSTYPLPRAGSLLVGRDPECDVRLEDASISRRHAMVRGGDPPIVEDLGSRNGTRVSGKALAANAPTPLPHGTIAQLGNATLLLRAEASPKDPPEAARERIPPGVIARDPAMLRLYELVSVVAPSDLAVLVLGETGVGKEVLAGALHRMSKRSAAPFVRLNCAALSESLLESELFGYEKGAFTGANQPRAGLFEAAHRGTLFLDEVGEVSAATQAKLLRVLENGEVLRLGSTQPRQVDVRFVSATNRDLRACAEEGRFRMDLYFRLNGMSVTIPPLRERPLDLLELANAFLRAAREKLAKPAAALSEEAVNALRAHGWPGNVRELRNVVQRAAVVGRGDVVSAMDLAIEESPKADSAKPARVRDLVAPERPTDHAALAPPATAAAGPSEPGVMPLRGKLEAFERQQILEALEKCQGNQTKAAKALGISRRTLLEKLDAYQVSRPRKHRTSPDDE